VEVAKNINCAVEEIHKLKFINFKRVKVVNANGRTRPDETRVADIRKSISGSEGFTLTLQARKRESKN
jgi:hypothetical protein